MQAVEHARQHEHQVAQAVEVLARRFADGFFVAQRHHLSLGTAGTKALEAVDRIQLPPGYRAIVGGDTEIIWPAALASLICFALNAGLLRYIYAMERR